MRKNTVTNVTVRLSKKSVCCKQNKKIVRMKDQDIFSLIILMARVSLETRAIACFFQRMVMIFGFPM